jgi:hypothetical protein
MQNPLLEDVCRLFVAARRGESRRQRGTCGAWHEEERFKRARGRKWCLSLLSECEKKQPKHGENEKAR